jgi:hypothetical protein
LDGHPGEGSASAPRPMRLDPSSCRRCR